MDFAPSSITLRGGWEIAPPNRPDALGGGDSRLTTRENHPRHRRSAPVGSDA